MNNLFSVCAAENRDIDGFDLITILGLMKEYNLNEIWRRYLPAGATDNTTSMYVQADCYFLEMHVQEMRRVILSEKFNTNPFFMQQVIQRVTASHDRHLILEKIRNQGIDCGDNPICLSCSLGNTIIDLIVNPNDPFPDPMERPRGKTHIETVENRPLDVYDLSSILYLCQQNLTEAIFRRYLDPEGSAMANRSDAEVNIVTRVGEYTVGLRFHLVSTAQERVVAPPGSVSVSTMHQVLQRMNFRHASALVLKELHQVGLAVTIDQVDTEFALQRYINNTALQLDFKRT